MYRKLSCRTIITIQHFHIIKMVNSSNNNILIVGEIPVIHKGYVDFFNKILKRFPQSHFYWGFLADKIVKELTKFEPDIRKLPISDAKKAISAYLPLKGSFLFNKNNFSRAVKTLNPRKIIILKGDKSEDFARTYSIAQKYKKIIQYDDVRLKWRSGKVAEFKKESDKLSEKELAVHKKFMKEAVKESEKSKCWWRQVGAVLVKNGKIILRTFNEMMPFDDECYKIGCVRDEIPPGKLSEICSVAHSEAAIIASAAQKGSSLKGTTIYVTHFPCPACAKLIALSGIKKLIYWRGSAVFDGKRVMESRGVEIIKI